jgi:hypothetical protein
VEEYAEDGECWCIDRGDGTALCGGDLEGGQVPHDEVPSDLVCQLCETIHQQSKASG